MTKFAVLVGCNYPNKRSVSPLFGCYNDVEKMKLLLTTSLGFDARNIQVLKDNSGSPKLPTKANIERALCGLVRNAKPGDVIFFYFAGHGCYNDTTKDEVCFRDEYIVPADINLMCGKDFQEICYEVPDGATFTILADSCHSGGLIYTAKEQVGPGFPPEACVRVEQQDDQNRKAMIRRLLASSLLPYFKSLTGKDRSDIGAYMIELFKDSASHSFRGTQGPDKTVNGGILISGCQPNESSFEDEDDERKPCGALTKVVVNCLMNNNSASSPITNKALVEHSRKIFDDAQQNSQHPCLYCTDDNADAVFLGPHDHHAENSTGCFIFLQEFFDNLCINFGRRTQDQNSSMSSSY